MTEWKPIAYCAIQNRNEKKKEKASHGSELVEIELVLTSSKKHARISWFVKYTEDQVSWKKAHVEGNTLTLRAKSLLICLLLFF